MRPRDLMQTPKGEEGKGSVRRDKATEGKRKERERQMLSEFMVWRDFWSYMSLRHRETAHLSEKWFR